MSLVDAKISESGLRILGEYIGSTRKITELDISWNTLKPRAYEVLLTSLSQSRSITHLNLSWNTLFEDENHAEDYKKEESEIKNDETVWYMQVKLNAFNKSVINLLSEIIKKNKSLLHLNLDATGLSEATVCMIGKTMRRAKSLLSIHLSNNPGTSPRAVKTISETIHAYTRKNLLHQEFRLKQLMSNFAND